MIVVLSPVGPFQTNLLRPGMASTIPLRSSSPAFSRAYEMISWVTPWISPIPKPADISRLPTPMIPPIPAQAAKSPAARFGACSLFGLGAAGQMHQEPRYLVGRSLGGKKIEND